MGAFDAIRSGSGFGVQSHRGLVWVMVAVSAVPYCTIAGKASCRGVHLPDGCGGHLGVSCSYELVLAQAGPHQSVRHGVVRLGKFVHEINVLLVF